MARDGLTSYQRAAEHPTDGWRGSDRPQVARYPPAVGEAAIDVYRDAFVARGRHELDSEPVVLGGRGARGVAFARLLVTDDSGYDRVVAELAAPSPGVLFVLERASRCNELLRGQPGWSAHSEMAMVLRDVDAVTDARLPDGLEVRIVRRLAAGAQDAVPLTEAVRVAVVSDLGFTDQADKVARFLGGLPSSVRVLAAVDDGGLAHATSACHVFGEYTQLFFVNTEPAWRRRGIGQAMTVAAVRAAGALGARSAFLHATDEGVAVYERLGFEAVGLLTRYSHAR
jgi:GNAT superfamily N-acetyltransferase